MGIRILVARGPGTNCDIETADSLQEVGAEAEVVHVNRILKGRVSISDYHGLVFPGGFSYGDHIRSGGIFGKLMGELHKKELEEFVEEEKPILGICNGFQVLVEAGLLPDVKVGAPAQIALGKNASNRFEDRWVFMKKISKSNIFTRGIEKPIRMPVANGEGRIILSPEKEDENLKILKGRDQVALRYTFPDGSYAGGSYPENPSGSYYDIAGINNDSGTIFGLMPHPERAFNRLIYPDWTREGNDSYGDGYLVFKNMVEYIKKEI